MALDSIYPFATPEDICNRALDHIGARHITSLTDGSNSAVRCAGVYDRVRQAELRRNMWKFSRRRTALRPLSANTTLVMSNTNFTPDSTPNTGTLLLTPATWSATTLYTPGAIVSDPVVAGLIWTSNAFDNLGNTPGVGAGAVWDVYYGPLTVSPFDPTESYWAGELVYITDPNTQVVQVFRSLVNNNGSSSIQTVTQTLPLTGNQTNTTTISVSVSGEGNPWIVNEWNDAVTYNRDQIISYEFTLYRSTTEQNMGNVPPSSARWATIGLVSAPVPPLASGINWLPIQASVQSFIMDYPMGAGPLGEPQTMNAFRLPNGFLREAVDNPRQGSFSFLGTPSFRAVTDRLIEGNYLVSSEVSTILFPFIADVTMVSKMDPMFCEGLAARIGMEICESLTQSAQKFMEVGASYKVLMTEARMVNSIEQGSVQPSLDDFIACRA